MTADADTEAWDDLTFSAPALRYFGLQRLPAARAGPAPVRPQAAAAAAAVSRHEPAASTVLSSAAAIDMDALDDALDDVDFSSMGPAPVRTVQPTGTANMTVIGTATATPPEGIRGAERPAPRTASAGASAGAAAAWELVDSDEASDAVMQAEAHTLPATAPATTALSGGASAALMPVAGFGGLISLLADYYQQGRTGPSAAQAVPSSSTGSRAQPGWVPVPSTLAPSVRAVRVSDFPLANTGTERWWWPLWDAWISAR